MDHLNKNDVAIWLKEGRTSRGYTQQELSDLTGISIRSVQRIENGEVIPREHTLRLLTEQLGLKDIRVPEQVPIEQAVTTAAAILSPAPHKMNKPRKIILSTGAGLFLILGTSAFVAQSPRFPETAFEAFTLWSVITMVYTIFLYWLWK